MSICHLLTNIHTNNNRSHWYYTNKHLKSTVEGINMRSHNYSAARYRWRSWKRDIDGKVYVHLGNNDSRFSHRKLTLRSCISDFKMTMTVCLSTILARRQTFAKAGFNSQSKLRSYLISFILVWEISPQKCRTLSLSVKESHIIHLRSLVYTWLVHTPYK